MTTADSTSDDDDHVRPTEAFLARYERGIQQLSRDFLMSESRVRYALGATPGRTAECLQPDELEDMTALTADRIQHVSSCQFCHNVKVVMESVATYEETELFAGLATHQDIAEPAANCATCGQPNESLARYLGRLGLVEVKKGGTFVKENGKVAAGVAALAVGAGLLYSAWREEAES